MIWDEHPKPGSGSGSHGPNRQHRPKARRRRAVAAIIAALLLTGCAETVAGTAALPGASNPGQVSGSPTGPSTAGPQRPVLPSGGGAAPVPAPGGGGLPVPPGQANPPGQGNPPGLGIPGNQPGTNPQGGTGPKVNPGGTGPNVNPGGTGNTPGTPTSAPSWVGQGTRITHYMIASNRSESTSVRVEDPNGDWQDPKTGKRYRSVEVAGDGTGNSSGDGYNQYDIRGIAGGSMFVTTSLYAIDHLTDVFMRAGSTGTVVTGPNLDGVWIHPDTLAAMKASPPAGTEVIVGPYELDGTTYQAITFDNKDPNGHQSYTYDTVTGLLVAASTRNVATSPANPGETPSGANTQLSTTLLKGVRQRAVLGQAGSNPSWVATTPQLGWSGTYNFTNPMDPGSAPFIYPMSVAISLGQGAGPWLPYTSKSSVQMPDPVQGSGSGLVGPDGFYWYDPAALAGLKAGQVIDQDPVTGETFSVVAVDANTVTMQDTMPGLDWIAVYDASSGVLLSIQQHQSTDGTTYTLQLETGPR